MDNESLGDADVLGLTAQIVAAHISHNSVGDGRSGKPHPGCLSHAGHRGPRAGCPGEAATGGSGAQSVFPDYIVCLEDGKKLKMLKRHLKTAYGMTPDQYRDRWGLGPEYPMVAPNYASHRSRLAKKIGLGTKSRSGDGLMIKSRNGD